MFSSQLCSRCRRDMLSSWPENVEEICLYVTFSWLNKGKALFTMNQLYALSESVVLQAFVIWWELWIAVVDGMLAILPSALEPGLSFERMSCFPCLPDVVVHLCRISMNSVVIHWWLINDRILSHPGCYLESCSRLRLISNSFSKRTILAKLNVNVFCPLIYFVMFFLI